MSEQSNQDHASQDLQSEVPAESVPSTQCKRCNALMPAGFKHCGECGKLMHIVEESTLFEQEYMQRAPDEGSDVVADLYRQLSCVEVDNAELETRLSSFEDEVGADLQSVRRSIEVRALSTNALELRIAALERAGNVKPHEAEQSAVQVSLERSSDAIAKRVVPTLSELEIRLNVHTRRIADLTGYSTSHWNDSKRLNERIDELYLRIGDNEH